MDSRNDLQCMLYYLDNRCLRGTPHVHICQMDFLRNQVGIYRLFYDCVRSIQRWSRIDYREYKDLYIDRCNIVDRRGNCYRIRNQL